MTDIQSLEQRLDELRSIPTPPDDTAFENVLRRMKRDAEELQRLVRPEIRFDPTIEVAAAPPADVRVNVPDQSAAISALTDMFGRLLEALIAKEAVVNVTVDAVPVKVEMTMPADHRPERKLVEFKRDGMGRIDSAVVTEE